MPHPLAIFEEQRAYRLIPSKFPPIDIYEHVAHPEELEAVFAVEALTNPRINDQVGNLDQVKKEDRLVGIANAGFVMGAFCHVAPEGARFNTGDFGAYYCAENIETSIKETVYHMERIFGYTEEPAQAVDMRSLAAVFSAELVDLRTEALSSDLYHKTNYRSSQTLAEQLFSKGADGVVYHSVRHQDHFCFALYKPRLVTRITQGSHYSYKWNGHKISHVLKVSLAFKT